MPSAESGFECRIDQWLKARGETASRRFVKKVAAMIADRQLSMSDADLERVFMVADPTPPAAFREIARNDKAAARRLGLALA